MKFKQCAITTMLLAIFLLGALALAWSSGPGEGTAKAETLAPAQAAGSENSNPPKVFFPEIAFQFEPVMDGNRVSHTFTVKNEGQGPLSIEKVKTG
jgi:hypothetical protein